jgi:hypothetical protein
VEQVEDLQPFIVANRPPLVVAVPARVAAAWAVS